MRPEGRFKIKQTKKFYIRFTNKILLIDNKLRERKKFSKTYVFNNRCFWVKKKKETLHFAQYFFLI